MVLSVSASRVLVLASLASSALTLAAAVASYMKMAPSSVTDVEVSHLIVLNTLVFVPLALLAMHREGSSSAGRKFMNNPMLPHHQQRSLLFAEVNDDRATPAPRFHAEINKGAVAAASAMAAWPEMASAATERHDAAFLPSLCVPLVGLAMPLAAMMFFFKWVSMDQDTMFD